MFCQFPIMSSKRDLPWEAPLGTRKDRESTIKPMSKVKGCKSIRDTFLRRPIYRQSQLNIGWTEEHCARLHEIAAETILTLLRRPNEHDAKTLGFSCLTVQDQTDPWIKEKIMRRPRKLVNVYIKNLAKLTTDFILESEFECDQTKHLLGTMKVQSASTRRQAESGTTSHAEYTCAESSNVSFRSCAGIDIAYKHRPTSAKKTTRIVWARQQGRTERSREFLPESIQTLDSFCKCTRMSCSTGTNNFIF